MLVYVVGFEVVSKWCQKIGRGSQSSSFFMAEISRWEGDVIANIENLIQLNKQIQSEQKEIQPEAGKPHSAPIFGGSVMWFGITWRGNASRTHKFAHNAFW